MTQNNPARPPPNLPDYRPRGMSRGDKIAAWTMAFIVVLFALVTASKYLPNPPASPVAVPAATATTHPHSTPKPTPTTTRYVVVNTTSGYIWWLDNAGSPFTKDSAKKFTEGHSTYRVATLQVSQ